MREISLKKEVAGTMEVIESEVTALLKEEGFGVLTRIDLSKKFKENLGKEIRPTLILGFCNPELAYRAFSRNTDAASVLPCNAIVRELDMARYSVELAKPSALMEAAGGPRLAAMASSADARLAQVLERLQPTLG